MTRLPTDECAAFVGIDWADATHDVCLQAAGSPTREFSVLEPQPDTIEAWVSTVRTRFKGPPMALWLELNTGPLVAALGQDDCLVLFPVNPFTRARYREAFTPSHATDDPPDAELPRELLRTHRDTLQPLNPQSPAIRALAPLVEHRRRLVGDNVRLTNRLTRALQHDVPPVLHWFDAKDTPIVCDVLTPWPTLKAVQLARRSTLERFCRAPQVRDADVIAQRLHAIKRATPLTTDAGGIAPTALLVQALVSPLRVTWHAIDDCDAAMAPRAQSHPDFPLLNALPGAGAVLAPRLLAAFGAPRDRDTSADALPTYAGIAPVTERRGHTSWVHWRLQGPTVRRHTCVEWAAESLRHAFWARASDQQQRHTGTSPPAAVRALACTWIRRLVRCWHKRTPDDASVYLNALERRGSPLRHNLVRAS